MWSLLISLLGSPVLREISEDIKDLRVKQIEASVDEKKLLNEQILEQLRLRQQVVLQEQGRWYTAWIRPLLAMPVVIFVWKILVWDTVLQMGVTPEPGDLVRWIVITIIGAYMLSRPFEKRN
jgi:hypothetical protein